MYLCGGPSDRDEFQGGGESIDSYPPISLTHVFVQELPENELVAIVSSVKDRVMETNSNAAVRED